MNNHFKYRVAGFGNPTTDELIETTVQEIIHDLQSKQDISAYANDGFFSRHLVQKLKQLSQGFDVRDPSSLNAYYESRKNTIKDRAKGVVLIVHDRVFAKDDPQLNHRTFNKDFVVKMNEKRPERQFTSACSDFKGGCIDLLRSKPYGDELFHDEWAVTEACTGFKTNEKYIITVGHCACLLDEREEGDFSKLNVIFGMDQMTIGPNIQIPKSQIAKVEDIKVSHQKVADFAVFKIINDKMNRDYVSSVPSLEIDFEMAVRSGFPLYMLGFPLGLSLKFTHTAWVTDESPSNSRHFHSNLDSFHGNSGSPVFDAYSDKVIGILVAGRCPFVEKEDSIMLDDCGFLPEDCLPATVQKIKIIKKYLT